MIMYIHSLHNCDACTFKYEYHITKGGSEEIRFIYTWYRAQIIKQTILSANIDAYDLMIMNIYLFT